MRDLSYASQVYKSIKSREECRDCKHYYLDGTATVSVPFCIKRWFGEECKREVRDGIELYNSFHIGANYLKAHFIKEACRTQSTVIEETSQSEYENLIKALGAKVAFKKDGE